MVEEKALGVLEPEDELIDELSELEEIEEELNSLDNEEEYYEDYEGDEVEEMEGEDKEFVSLPVDSFGEENFEISLTLDEDPEDMDEEELELMSELYGELAEAQELGFLKRIFKRVRKAVRKVWRKKWFRTAVAIGATVGSPFITTYIPNPRLKTAIRRRVFKVKRKWWAFRRWTSTKKWRVKRWIARRRWLTKVRKLRRKHPRSWWRRLKRANRLKIAYRARARTKRYLVLARRYRNLWRRTKRRSYLNLYRKYINLYNRWYRTLLKAVRKPIRRVRRAIRKKPIKIQPVRRTRRVKRTPQTKPSTSPISRQQQADLQQALMPLLLVGGGLTLIRLLRA